VLERLRGSQLLGPEELRALDMLRDRHPDPADLIAAVLRRGWLTVYQARELFAGRGQELLLGDYVVLERLGEGSTSRVYKARHRPSGRVVALKVLRGGLAAPETIGRLRQERRHGTRLEHPNILKTFGAGRADDAYFLVMEYVEGKDLGRLVREQGPLPVGRACDYARQAALGLEHAVERGLVHRDMKPSNLLLAKETGLIKILDLGLACLAETGPVTALRTAGTPDYVAPEQVFGSGGADTRSDIYALGGTLYHLLSGRPPFPGGTQEEKLLNHRGAEPEAIETLRPEVPPGLGAVVRQMMAKAPEDRFPTPAAVAVALEPFAEAGSCDSHFVLELEAGLVELDPGQSTAILGPARADPETDR
jgi:serine/threonine-protein kinase